MTIKENNPVMIQLPIFYDLFSVIGLIRSFDFYM